MKTAGAFLAGLPWATAAIVALALWAGGDPARASTLEWNRAAIASGEVWRLLTGHLVHWTPRMAWVDLSAALALGTAIETLDRRLLRASALASAALVGPGLLLVAPSLERYRGMSGIAAGWLAALAVDRLRAGPRRVAGWLAAAALGAFLAKTGWEIVSGRALLVGPLPEGVAVTPAAHLAGALGGIVAAVVPRRQRVSDSPEPDREGGR